MSENVRLTLAEFFARKEAGTLPAVWYIDDAPTPSATAPSATAPSTASPSSLSANGGKGKGKSRGRTRSERFAVANAFVDLGMSIGKLTGAEVKVWLILWRDTKRDGTARTGQADIARRAGLTVRAIKKAIASLAAKGFVSVVTRGKLNVGPSIYRVHGTGNS